MREGYRHSLSFCLEHAWMFVVLFLAVLPGFRYPLPFCSAAISFPSVDAGLIRLHMRARAGQRVEETARECDRSTI